MTTAENNYYPPVGFQFTIKIAGQNESQASNFQKVSGIQTEMPTEQISEGGENSFRYQLPGVIKYENLVLMRGLLPKDGPLFTWVKDTLNQNLIKPIEPKTLLVSLMDHTGKKIMGWVFQNAYPVKWEIVSLDSLGDNIAVEKMEFAYSSFRQTELT